MCKSLTVVIYKSLQTGPVQVGYEEENFLFSVQNENIEVQGGIE